MKKNIVTVMIGVLSLLFVSCASSGGRNGAVAVGIGNRVNNYNCCGGNKCEKKPTCKKVVVTKKTTTSHSHPSSGKEVIYTTPQPLKYKTVVVETPPAKVCAETSAVDIYDTYHSPSPAPPPVESHVVYMRTPPPTTLRQETINVRYRAPVPSCAPRRSSVVCVPVPSCAPPRRVHTHVHTRLCVPDVRCW